MTLDWTECGGAPRDQGMAQGLVRRGAVRDRVSRAGVRVRRRPFLSLRPFVSGPVLGAGPGREVVRHYTHLAERMEGIALAAGLPLESVMALLVERPGALEQPATAVAVRSGDGARLGRSLPGAPDAHTPWMLRRSRPEIGFQSLDLTLPWLPGAVAGVNECGVAAVLAPRPDPGVASLLVQEVLQRFGELDSALDWCLKRPAWGGGLLMLCDAAGELAAVELVGKRRLVHRGDEAHRVDGETALAGRIRKQLAEHAGAPIAELEATLSAECADADAHAGRVWLDPAGRQLAWEPPEASGDDALRVGI